MEFADALRVDEAPTHPERSGRRDRGDLPLRFRYELVVLLVAAAVFLGTCFGPPSLMDDVDAVQAQIARNMLDSGDWAARILIPDVILTLSITLAMWSMLRALEEDEPRAWRWAWTMAASIGIGLLLKGLITAVFPVAAGLIYLLLTRQLFARRTWERLRPFSGTLLILLIAAPWHVLATIRNPPYFYFSMRSVPGEYHGFFGFYVFNEHLLRFLNRRYPHDYNAVPRVYFRLFHLLWLFRWSAYLPAAARLGLLLNGRKMNLEYGSNAPDAPNVFLPDADFAEVWHRRDRFYLLVEGRPLARIRKLVPRADLDTVSGSGGKFLLTNHAYSN